MAVIDSIIKIEVIKVYMTRNFKNTFSLMMLMVFILPSIIKIEHHHEETFVCKAKHEKHFHHHHDKCAVCSFELSIFSTDFDIIPFSPEKPSDQYFNPYHSANHSRCADYSFLLRAPPALCV